MMQMWETLYGTGKAVGMDRDFYVSRGIVEWERKGVYGASLIKNKNCWPKGVPGDAIGVHFEDKMTCLSKWCVWRNWSMWWRWCASGWIWKNFRGDKHGGTILWTASRQPRLSAISSRSGCTTSSDIKSMTTITGGICLYRLRGHKLPSFGNIKTVHGIYQQLRWTPTSHGDTFENTARLMQLLIFGANSPMNAW